MPSLRDCIADFGLCSLTSHIGVRFTSTSTTFGAGTLLYQALELLYPDKDDRKQEKESVWMTLTSDVSPGQFSDVPSDHMRNHMMT
jgi:hypothetical protein